MPARGFKKKDLETLMMDNCNLKPYDVSSCTALRENFDLITLTVLTKTEDSGDDFSLHSSTLQSSFVKEK